MKMLVAGIALAALVASPAFAQTHDPHAARGFGSPTPGGNGEVHMNAARAAAIRACSGAAAKFSEYTWGDMEFQQYRSCMAEHGQVE